MLPFLLIVAAAVQPFLGAHRRVCDHARLAKRRHRVGLRLAFADYGGARRRIAARHRRHAPRAACAVRTRLRRRVSAADGRRQHSGIAVARAPARFRQSARTAFHGAPLSGARSDRAVVRRGSHRLRAGDRDGRPSGNWVDEAAARRHHRVCVRRRPRNVRICEARDDRRLRLQLRHALSSLSDARADWPRMGASLSGARRPARCTKI